MGEFGNAIKYLYEKFILRDLLSFVTPGAIIVLTAFLLLLPELGLKMSLEKLFEYSRDMHWLLYIPLFGLFFIVGFSVQCFGEIFDIIRFTPRDQGTWHQRFRIFGINWANEANIWWKGAHKKLVAFNEYIEREDDKKEWARQQHERMVVLKQMCANGSLAIVFAGVLLAISCILSLWVKLVLAILLVVAPLLVSLFWGFRVHVLRQDTIRRAVLHELDD